MAGKSHYPTYNVMREQDEWDDHTQKIVTARLVREHDYRFLTTEEAEMLRSICTALADDTRGDVIQYVLVHIDETLSQSIGESQRKPGVPPADALVREGLAALDRWCMRQYLRPFIDIEPEKQVAVLRDLSEQKLALEQPWSALQQELFSKWLNLTVEAYYSHPLIWSEIGYGGPAYPRGYVRTGLGQLDPWEAKADS